jgi:hypothetical protein
MDEAPRSRRVRLYVAIAALVVVAVGVGLFLALSGEDKASAQTVTFQKPTETGADPFTVPADVHRKAKVDVGSGPFGGSGSDLVCDRELLIRSLRARPDRMREWARVLGVEPDIRSVARYIRKLRAVTLTQDTRVTNHTFVDGHAVALQSILQAGTAVLVDRYGVPVTRCRCGNPLLKPVYIATAQCIGCPAHYRPPRTCVYVDFSRLYRDYNGDEFLRVYRRRDFANSCYLPYPKPPTVRGARPPTTRTPGTSPTASFSPSSGTSANTYTLNVSGFRPNATLSVALTRPDGVRENYSIQTDSSGSGSHNFGRVSKDVVLGTYTAVVTDPGTGDSATASTRVSAAAPQQQQPDSGGLQCNPPRSQLESERCAEQRQSPTPPQPDPNYDCPSQPPAHPGEDYLRNCR